MTIKNLLCAGACGLSLAGLAAPTVSDVVIQPRWPWSTKVDVHFVLSGVDAPVDVACTFRNDGVALEQPAGSVTGDLTFLENGAYTVTYDPVAAGYGSNVKLPALTVDIVPVTAKLYMIVDLKASLANTAEARISYTNKVVGANSRWDDYYKTNCVVLRYIKAGTFMMGAKSTESSRGIETSFRRQVTLTKDFYIGVFEIPQGIYKRILGSGYPYTAGNDFTAEQEFRPVARVSYAHMRNDSWSCTNSLAEARTVTDGCWIGKFRAKTGGALQFDLPTEAQWEYACRAGTDTSFYNGYDITSASATHDGNLDPLARYRYNDGFKDDGATDPLSEYATVSTANGTARLGTYAPNAWGLYDMLGNAAEWVLDWCSGQANTEQQDEAIAQTVDPRGPRTSNDMSRKFRTIKGGSWYDGASTCRCSSRTYGKSETGYRTEQHAGFRLCLTPNEY